MREQWTEVHTIKESDKKTANTPWLRNRLNWKHEQVADLRTIWLIGGMPFPVKSEALQKYNRYRLIKRLCCQFHFCTFAHFNFFYRDRYIFLSTFYNKQITESSKEFDDMMYTPIMSISRSMLWLSLPEITRQKYFGSKGRSLSWPIKVDKHAPYCWKIWM